MHTASAAAPRRARRRQTIDEETARSPRREKDGGILISDGGRTRHDRLGKLVVRLGRGAARLCGSLGLARGLRTHEKLRHGLAARLGLFSGERSGKLVLVLGREAVLELVLVLVGAWEEPGQVWPK